MILVALWFILGAVPPAAHVASLPPVVLIIESKIPWTTQQDLARQVREIARASAHYWGASPDELNGWTIRIVDRLFFCNEHVKTAIGCTDWTKHEILLSTFVGLVKESRCLQETALPHELGHVFVNQPQHEDRRWNGAWTYVKRRLSRSARRHGCQTLSVEVWRVPPGW